ncbi:MAG: sensor histidine kinase [Bacteroidota bacterium]
MTTPSTILDHFLKARILNHTVFWIAVVFGLAYHGSLFGGNIQDNSINMMALLPVQMIATYSLIYFLIPKVFQKGRYLLFTISFLVIAYLLSALGKLSVIHIALPIVGLEPLEETIGEILMDPTYLIKVFTTSVYIPAITLYLLKMTKERFMQQNQLIMLEKEKQKSELDFLKAQMNPHFLFNTLNNIYGLSKNNSENAPDMILKLSEILDYTIYECNEDTVPIMKEWALIENYVDLETLRYHDQLTILLEEEVDDKESRVAPLILIALVENAFKYSLKLVEGIPVIKVFLKVEDGQLSFEVFNTKAQNLPESHEKSKRIGVQNMKRQLDLQYLKDYTLEIDDKPESYKVNLTINLKD